MTFVCRYGRAGAAASAANSRWRRQGQAFLRALLPACAALLLGCVGGVTRLSNGVARLERPISSEAYSSFARARLLEAAGDGKGALAAYRQVLVADPEADEALVRIGSLLCRVDPKGAAEAFREASQRNRESAELYEARARCDLHWGKPETALGNAERALGISPEDPRRSELVIRAYVRAGRHSEALRYAWSHVAIYPEDTRGWYLLSEVLGPKSALYPQLLRRASERIPSAVVYSLPRMDEGLRLPERLDRTAQAELELDAALAAADTRAVHRAARRLGLSTLDLIDRCMKVGAFDVARSQAQLAGSLLPDDPALWQLRLVLADLAGDDAEFELLLAQPPRLPTRANVNWTELNQLIDRRAGVRLHTASTKPSR